jgi:hypothetical protein
MVDLLTQSFICKLNLVFKQDKIKNGKIRGYGMLYYAIPYLDTITKNIDHNKT